MNLATGDQNCHTAVDMQANVIYQNDYLLSYYNDKQTESFTNRFFIIA